MILYLWLKFCVMEHTIVEVISMNDNSNMPTGLRMALTGNLEALNHFSSLSQGEQERFIEGAKQVNSKQEMQSYVDHLTLR